MPILLFLPKHSLSYQLLRLPLFYKILLANSTIVGFGAVVGTYYYHLADTLNRILADQERYAQEMQQLPRQILQAQEEERYRLTRELHDEAAQALTSLLVHLRLLERAKTPENAQAEVPALRQLSRFHF